ncbi:acetyl-CoA acetyltransferase [Megasphaera cerevisiae DSM 20462]|jgi:acetyl-CoA C-acetyltransferase|uniref:acetyl-CoA C-acetyltransferase n=1 Tax=Megasphaera cerevisiae DSM 20462 TaxID=1122219 RepID=A0A0J6WSY8_9FIRM|nr:acetyl-CoA C-acetyltransferase [Megasphaera cerevisiae]KMO86625.1 acetyl-CoA acetyltransferase [Megasphaera cerevisiae DSM 20462]MCI1750423.1 acetyl-CoA C-acetyltransferase [Megasphaera cerevisiae]OKY53037.1 acetyl-CoA acetyltransferase [Megasphaera cerevisiae]SJZ89019.1 acetyl-CoA C-acetyltransferase [Megasphaera cerevisiae DSM 20462]
MRDAVIVSACRTAIGSFNGQFADVPAVDLGIAAVKEAVKRAGIPVEQIDEVIMGHVLQAGCGENTARQVSLHAGIPQEVPAFTLNKLCGSGMRAISLAAQQIQLGDADIIVAGGMESMSNAPYALAKARRGYRMGNGALEDLMLRDGLICTENSYHMGVTAENIADRFGVTREDQDALALRSQKLAYKAQVEGKFDSQIVPVIIHKKKGDVICDKDEFIRPNVTMEDLAKLRPAFIKNGTVTAGNASGINDGAAAVIVMSADKAKELGIKPIAKILGWASAGVEPAIMGTGPIPAVHKVLKKVDMTVDQMDLIELNEAFAAQSVYCCRELGVNMDHTNIHGGAIALGHPIGCSGARILVTLLYAMSEPEINGKYGLASLCIGGGQGTALVVERL